MPTAYYVSKCRFWVKYFFRKYRLANISLRIALVSFLLITSASLTSCSRNPATGEQSFTGFINPTREKSIGATEHPKLLKAFGGVYKDSTLSDYVTSLGTLLQSSSELPSPPFIFTLLDSPIVNAFALPGGYVYVTRGLMALANDEAELAGVIAHEIGHVTARHAAQRISRGMLANLGAAVLGAAVGQPILKDVVNYATGAYVQGYSRDQEFQADQLGIRYLTRSGFDPSAMASFLSSMEGETKLAKQISGKQDADPSYGLFSSHPRTEDRITEAANIAKGSTDALLSRDSNIYLNKIDGMIYGDSPEQGLIKGREFNHPILRFHFTAPPGFRLKNTPTAVFGEHHTGAIMRFDSDNSFDASVSEGLYLSTNWGKNIILERQNTLTINGMPAATAISQINTRNGVKNLHLTAIRHSESLIYRFLFITSPNHAANLNNDYNQATFSFKKLSKTEAATLKPRRIKIWTVKFGDTIKNLSDQMAFDDFKAERFVALNGLQIDELLIPGERLKIISY